MALQERVLDRLPPNNSEAEQSVLGSLLINREATRRRLIDAGSTIVTIGYNDDLELIDALDKSEKLIFDVAQDRLERDFKPISHYLDAFFERIDFVQEHRGELVGVPTGFADLDKMTGGLQQSDLIIIAARPGVGKSSLSLTMAYNAALRYGKRTGVFSLEMSGEQLVQR